LYTRGRLPCRREIHALRTAAVCGAPSKQHAQLQLCASPWKHSFSCTYLPYRRPPPPPPPTSPPLTNFLPKEKENVRKTTLFAGTDRQYSKTSCQCIKTRAQSIAEKYFHWSEACLEAGGCHSTTVLRNDIKSELQRKHGLQIPDGCRFRIR
jgi:hypothetical protein